MKLFNEFNRMMAMTYGEDWESDLSGEQVAALQKAFYSGALVAVGEVAVAGRRGEASPMMDKLESLKGELASWRNSAVQRACG